MVVFLSIAIVILLCVVVAQYRAGRTRSASLRRVHEQLRRIVADGTSEKVLAVTGDKELIPLLIAINDLLETNRANAAHGLKTEMSVKRMISNISHDLKTPLTVIQGYLETLKLDHTMNAAERNALLSKVHQKTIEVLGLIHKFFDLARLESGDKDLPLGRIDLSEVCRRKILQFYDILSGKGLDVRIRIPDVPVYILGNEEALDRILDNLISNAVKYGGDGNVIGLTLRFDDSYAAIDVWDKGRGIGEMHKDRVFERMYTLEDSRNRSNESSGLGLTITKRLVEKLGGTIHVNSKPDVETVFSIRFTRLTY
ncbi:Alkaline phosphatase synthesis sensor protein PhoR [Paenibacillus sp. CECT 9249]|uniref:sensor histidine kinase n=1 Tax=Paenibacillus sp. CECT 9249 TaxID=2845385 RepID=UPI001E3B1A46|nr:sensor histidine kinase [Paenibacillus sp. CECT 9249]CAH0120507.1 Alkaline phosphatase synthesis sensor protein PhoR [Paenibacillus sp. CECT 9249]